MLAFVALGAALAVSLFRCCAAEAERDRYRNALEQYERDLRKSGHLERLEELRKRIDAIRRAMDGGHHDLPEGKR